MTSLPSPQTRDQDSEWQTIDTAPKFERVMVSGWNKPTKRTEGYWWWHEDIIIDGKAFDHPEATLWCRVVLPPFHASPSSQGEEQ